MKVLLVANPASGGAGKHDRDEMLSALAPLGPIEAIEPSSQEAFGAEVRAAAAGRDLVVVGGGDGTLNCTVNALGDRVGELTFAVLPLGTGNDLARTFSLPPDPIEAARGLEAGSLRDLDVCKAAGPGVERLFVNACMGGFPVQVNDVLDDGEKETLGAAAFIWGGAKALTDLQRSTVVMAGMEVPDCVAVGVGNGRTCGGGIEVWPDADPGDGALEGCALAAEGAVDLVKLATKLKFGDHRDLEGVETSSGAEISIRSEPAIEINVDGELIGLKTPATFGVVAKTRLLVPPPSGS